MSAPIRINKTGQVITTSAFIETVSLQADAATVIRLYDGTNENGELKALLACGTAGSDHSVVNSRFKDGIYATMTATGSGYGVGLAYQR